MTRTTELLKRIEEHEKRTSCMYVTGRNELKGRLGALKEEVEFIKICAKNLNTIDYEENDRTTLAVCRDINYRLASIQEEIKLIEGKI